MRKYLTFLVLIFVFAINPIFAEENFEQDLAIEEQKVVEESQAMLEERLYDPLYDGYKAVYDIDKQVWSTVETVENKIVLTKKLYEGTGSYSQYLYENGSLAITMSSDFEFIKDGVFVAVDNNNMQYYKLIYNGEGFEEVPLTLFELQKLFPDVTIIRLSTIDPDNKMWITKPFFKNMKLLFVNDSDKCYYRLTAMSKKAQNQEFLGLVTLYRFGIFRFKHYGERNGKLTLYVR